MVFKRILVPLVPENYQNHKCSRPQHLLLLLLIELLLLLLLLVHLLLKLSVQNCTKIIGVTLKVRCNSSVFICRF